MRTQGFAKHFSTDISKSSGFIVSCEWRFTTIEFFFVNGFAVLTLAHDEYFLLNLPTKKHSRFQHPYGARVQD